MVLLTRPRFRVITSTKWEVNMSRKYRVASSATVSKIVGTLSAAVLVLFAKKIIDKKAKESCVHG